MADVSKLKVAIVCDWLTGIGGAERVVLELHRLFPEAPIYTSQYDPSKIDWFKSADVRTTWLQKLPTGLKKFLPVLRAWSFSRLNLKAYDLIISSSGAEAKGVRKRPDAVHVCICHAPTHYYWSRYEAYLKQPGFGIFDPLARLGLRILVGPLRRWDLRAAQRPDHIIANSTHSQQMIEQYYHRDSTVIYPPVDVERFTALPDRPRKGFIAVGRQTPYKKIDLAVAACTELNLPLTVLGSGPQHEYLQSIAGPNVTFKTDANDQEVAEALTGAEAFLFPGVDDFGIVAVEAQAAGTPVIAFRGGGALDTVVQGKTGEFFDEQTVASLVSTLRRFKSSNYASSDIKTHAINYNSDIFKKNLQEYLKSILQ